jgi:hypothetical protein
MAAPHIESLIVIQNLRGLFNIKECRCRKEENGSGMEGKKHFGGLYEKALTETRPYPY